MSELCVFLKTVVVDVYFVLSGNFFVFATFFVRNTPAVKYVGDISVKDNNLASGRWSV